MENENNALSRLRKELEKLKEKAGNAWSNRGTFEDGGRGIAEGFRVTPEDRRDMLWYIRDKEGKAEPPRATQTFATQPGIDWLRQIKTVDPNGLGRILPGITPFKDEVFMERANAGMNLGPNPDELNDIGRLFDTRTGDPEALARYKKALNDLPLAQKLGHFTGTALSDVTQDSTRAIWWLLNAPQAVSNVLVETGAAVGNPDLYARKEVALEDAVDKGLVSYKQPRFKKELIEKMTDEVADPYIMALGNEYMSTQDDPTVRISEAQFAEEILKVKRDARRTVEAQLQAEAKQNLKNYKSKTPGVKVMKDRILKNRFNPNLVNAAVVVPSALAINQGIGLLGRREGYADPVPDELDETQSANPAFSFLTRYFLGREGQLLDQEKFLLERPDENAAGYAEYKGYLRDRDIDLNPFDDGKVNFGGVLKNNPDGIRGAEISFLGKSLPFNDTLIPTASAIAGTALGAALTNAGSIRMRGGFKNRKGLGKIGGLMPQVLPRDKDTAARVYANAEDSKGLKPKDTFINRMQAEFDKDDGWKHNARVLGTVAGMGLAGAAAGSLAGNALEDERRRREFTKNKGKGVDYDTYKKRSQEILEDKRQLIRDNPNANWEKSESSVGFNKRNYQQSLLDGALTQQVVIDQISNEEQRRRAQSAQDNSIKGIAEAKVLDQQMLLEKEKSKREPSRNNSSLEAAQENYDRAVMTVAERYLDREKRKAEEEERANAIPLI